MSGSRGRRRPGPGAAAASGRAAPRPCAARCTPPTAGRGRAAPRRSAGTTWRTGGLAAKASRSTAERQAEGPPGHLHHVAGEGPGVAEDGEEADHALAADGGGLGGAALARRDDERDDAVLGPPDVPQLRVRLEQDRAARQVDALEVRREAAEVLGLERGEQAVARGGVGRVHGRERTRPRILVESATMHLPLSSFRHLIAADRRRPRPGPARGPGSRASTGGRGDDHHREAGGHHG